MPIRKAVIYARSLMDFVPGPGPEIAGIAVNMSTIKARTRKLMRLPVKLTCYPTSVSAGGLAVYAIRLQQVVASSLMLPLLDYCPHSHYLFNPVSQTNSILKIHFMTSSPGES